METKSIASSNQLKASYKVSLHSANWEHYHNLSFKYNLCLTFGFPLRHTDTAYAILLANQQLNIAPTQHYHQQHIRPEAIKIAPTQHHLLLRSDKSFLVPCRHHKHCELKSIISCNFHHQCIRITSTLEFESYLALFRRNNHWCLNTCADVQMRTYVLKPQTMSKPENKRVSEKLNFPPTKCPFDRNFCQNDTL